MLLGFGALFLIGVVGYVALTIQNDKNARADLARDLKIASLPASVHNLACALEPVPTDTLWHCYFEIDPNNSSALLTGRKYQVRAEKVASYDVQRKFVSDTDACCELGPDFTIAKQYFIWPSDFKHGGRIAIYTDAAQRQVLYDVYIE